MNTSNVVLPRYFSVNFLNFVWPFYSKQINQWLKRRGSATTLNSNVKCGRDLSRVATHTRDIYRDKTPPPVVNTTYERAPTPEPDVIEKIYIKREPQQIQEIVYQRPRTPPPVIIERQYIEPAPALVQTCK
jgi:hypothetical protein